MNDQSRTVDEDFLRFCTTQDATALGRVFDATASQLLIAASHLSRDAASAEDLVQLTFLQAIESAPGFRRGRPVLPWLLGILGHRARDEIRRHHRRSELLEKHAPALRGAPAGSSDPALVAETEEEMRLLAAAIEGLPQSYRQVLNLKLAHGLGATEIAHALGRPLATVKSQLARGARQLRDLLPASLASAIALLFTPERGLAAVRVQVLRAAAATTPATAAATLAFWGVMKKLSLGGVLTALMFGLVWLIDGAIAGTDPGADGAGTKMDAGAGNPQPEQAEAGTAGGEPSGSAQRQELPAAARPTAGESEGALALRLRWDDGTPAADLELSVFPAHLPHGRRDGLRLTSDRQGRVPDTILRSGRYRIYLSAECQAEVQVVAGKRHEQVLRLASCGQVSGVVLDSLGRPVQGAEICHQDDVQSVTNVLGRADRNGAFSARLWSERVALFARSQGYGRSERVHLNSLRHEHREIVLQLARGAAALRGRVLDASGEPVAGADVYANVPAPSLDNTISLEVGESMDRHVRSDAEGRFQLANVGPGEVELRVFANGHAPRTLEVEHLLGPRREVEVRLKAATVTAGSVLDPDGRALAGVRIQLLEQGRPGYLPATISDRHGRFQLQSLASGSHDLTVQHPRFGEFTQVVKITGAPIQLRFPEVPRIFGRALLPSGRPAAGWQVQAVAEGGSQAGRQMTTRCDEQGVFCFAPCHAPTYTVLLQQVRGRARLSCLVHRAVRPGDSRDGELILRLTPDGLPSARIRGRVLRPAGHSGARVRIQLSDRSRGMWVSAAARPDDGSLELGPLPPGTYHLRVTSPSSGLRPLDLGKKTLRPNQILDLGDLALDAITGLALQVSVAGGGVEPPLQVVLRRAKGRVLLFTGTWFRGWDRPMPALRPGKYLLEVQAGPRNLPSRHEVELFPKQKRTVFLALPHLQTVLFRLRGAKGVTVPAYTSLTLERRQGPTGFDQLFFNQARERVQGLPPGDYRLRLRGEPDLHAEHRFRVGKPAARVQVETIVIARR